MRMPRMGQQVAVEVDGETVLGFVIGINRVCEPPRYLVDVSGPGPHREAVVGHDEIMRLSN